jgi:hypothetical protein
MAWLNIVWKLVRGDATPVERPTVLEAESVRGMMARFTPSAARRFLAARRTLQPTGNRR